MSSKINKWDNRVTKIITIVIVFSMLFTYAGVNAMQLKSTGQKNNSNGVIVNPESSFPSYNVSYGTYEKTLVLSNDTIVNGYFNATNGLNPNEIAYDPQLNELFVTEGGSNSISAINLNNERIIYTIYIGGNPNGMYFDTQNGILYVANSGKNTISEIYALTGKMIGSITVGSNPQFFAYDSKNNTLFVTNWGSNDVTVINPVTNTVIKNIGVGTNPDGIIYDSNNNYIYVTNFNSNSVTVINALNYSIVTSISVSSNPLGIAVNNNNHIFVADYGSGEVTVINGLNNQVLLEISVQSNPYFVLINSTSNYVYVSNRGSNSISVFNGVNNEIITTINLPNNANPQGMFFMQSNGKIFVADNNINQISIVSSSKFTLLNNIYLSYTPDEVAYDPSNGYFYVTDGSNSLVYVISSVNYSIINVISVLSDPTDILYNPFNGNIYVANYNTYNVTVISGINNTIIGEPYVYGNPYKLAVNPSNGNVFVTIQSPPGGYGSLGGTGNVGIAIINGTNFKNINFIGIGGLPESIAYDPVNNNVYIATISIYLGFWMWFGYSGLAIVNLTNGAVSSVGFGSSPWGVAYDPANNNIYVTDSSNNNLYVLNTTTNSVVLTIPVGITPTQVFYNPWNQDIYTLNRGPDSFSVISSVNNTLMDTVFLGKSAHSSALSLAEGNIVATQSSNASLDILSMFSSKAYSLEFKENGLPSDTTWSVMLNENITSCSTSNTIVFAVPNGTYSYSIQQDIYYNNVERFVLTKFSGTVNVNGMNSTLSFNYIKQYFLTMYLIPQNAGKVFPGNVWVNNGSKVIINETPNEYYRFLYWVGSGNGSYSGNSSSATITMNSPIMETAYYEKLYNATFSEIGLTSGTEWSVSLSGKGEVLTEGSAGSGINFVLPNGTYSFKINNVTGYVQNPLSGQLIINGSGAIVKVIFTKLYNITFSQSGLPTGTNWSVSLYNYTNKLLYSIGIKYNSVNSVLAYDTQNGLIYVADWNNSYVWIINPSSQTVLGAIYIGSNTTSVTYDPANGNLYVTDYANTVTVINGISNSIITTINVGGDPFYSIYDPLNKNIYVADLGSANLTVINGTTNKVTGDISVGLGPISIALDTENGYLYVPNQFSNNVSVVNPSTEKSIASINVGSYPAFALYDSGDNLIYVTNSNSNNISVINPATEKVIRTIPLQNYSYPWGMVYDPSNNFIYVANINSVSMINPSTGTILQVINVYNYPNYFLYDPANSLIYVSGSENVSVIFYMQNTYLTKYSTGTSISFNEPSGYYSFNVSQIKGYRASQTNGSFYLNNTNININIKFYYITPKNYTITFSENGLPSGTTWSVTINGTTKYSTSSTITFSLPNDTYSYIVKTPISITSGVQYVTQGSGNFNVDGSNIGIMITYTEEFYLNISASPSKGGTVSPSSGWYPAGTSITISEFANTSFAFAYWVGTGDGSYSGNSSYATITMNGPIDEVAYFVPAYNVLFTESGLPPYTFWEVIFDNVQGSSNSNNITFSVPNGTYSFKVLNVSGYSVYPQSGTVTVKGAEVSVIITFYFISVNYNIIFTESGLSSGTSWSVTLNGLTKESSANTITFSEPNGTYSYSVSSVSGYRASPNSGVITVIGANVNQAIVFTPVTYMVSFSEIGLPSGSTWYVNLSNGQTFASSTNTITFSEPNGTYTFTIATNAIGYAPSQPSGSFTVNGVNVQESVIFTQIMYSVSFTESGLPSGTSWSVTLNGLTETSMNSTIMFKVPYGTYTYSISIPSGYKTSKPSGTITTNQSSTSVSIVVSATSTSSTTVPPTQTSSNYYLLIVIIAVIVVIAIVAGIILMKGKKKKGGPKEWERPPKQPPQQ